MHSPIVASRRPPRCPEYGCESTGVFEIVNLVRSNCTRVTGALEKDRHGLQHRFDPPLFGPSHESLVSHRSDQSYGSNYFLIKLMSPLRSTRATRILERSSVCALRRMSSSRSCVETWLRRIMRKSHWPLRTTMSDLPLIRIPSPWE